MDIPAPSGGILEPRLAPRSPRGAALRPVALAALLSLAACTAADESRSPPSGPAAGAPADATAAEAPVDADGRSLAPLLPALAALDEALVMHLDPALAYDMDPALEAAGEAIRAACADGALAAACAAARVALDTLVAWHGIVTGAATVDAAGRAALEQALLSSLSAVGGHVPQTEMMAGTILFESDRAGEAATRLRALLDAPGPHGAGYAPAHALVRSWRDALPDPLALVPVLVDAGAAGGADGFRSDLSPATAGLLHLAAGLAAGAEGDEARAIALYETGAEQLAAARGRDPLDAEWDLASWRADCLVNAGWLHFAAAQRALDHDGLPEALPSLQAAERDFSEAHAALPDDEEARRGVALTGDLYYQAGDLDGIRDYFGRAARRSDDPEWWNNHAFFCRETERYEESYEAYRRCIELAPGNARWVNDAGLILLYHLRRDLDRAEELFRRAWELGREVTENPFASEEAVQENFLAYTDAMLNLGRLWYEQGRLEEAAGIVADLLALAPDRADALHLQRAIEGARGSAASPDSVEAQQPVDDTDPEG